MPNELKVYEIKSSETDWFCGYSLLTALNNYLNTCQADLSEFDESDEVREVPKSEWDGITIDMETHSVTLREYMKGVSAPDVISSTAY